MNRQPPDRPRARPRCAQSLGQSPDEDGKRRPHIARHADRLEVVELVARAGEIADLDGGAHFILEGNALQLDRQRGNRRLGTFEAAVRLRPVALTRIGDRAPQRRIMLVADRGAGEILERVLWPVHHQLGHGAQHARGSHFGCRTIVGERHIEHRFGLGIHVASDIETGEFEPRRQTLVRWRSGGSGDETCLPLAIGRLPVESPELRIEHQRPQTAAMQDALQRVRERQTAGPAHHDLVGGKLDAEIVGDRLDHHALGRGERAEFDEVLLLEDAARRGKGGDDKDVVADLGIADPV